jgi:hypothetical protein
MTPAAVGNDGWPANPVMKTVHETQEEDNFMNRIE